MYVLGMDTSCDDTCIGVIKLESSPRRMKYWKFKILSNVVSSQVKLHAKYGGILPSLAKREHQKNLPIVFKKATQGIDISKIDLIGVTTGPGLEPCLWQGINFAKDLAEKLNLPLIPVNHLEAHILINWLWQNKKKNLLPAICLVVSGGHTILFLMKEIGKYKILGETRDDAAGECFDKVARILGLGFPGGPAIAQKALSQKSEIKNQKFKIKLPRPMMYTKDYDLSFSGLKTAVLYDFRNRSPKIRKSKEYIRKMCQEVQQAIIDVLIHKTLRVAKDFKVKSIILGGGVTANQELRKQFRDQSFHQGLKCLAPPKIFSTDNGVMIAITAFFHKKEKIDLSKIKAEPNLKI